MSAVESDLGPRGLRFWSWAQGEFEFGERETELLLESCRSLDMIEALAAAVARDGTTVVGSKGQPTLNPAIPELRQQQAALARLLSQLELEDEDEAAVKDARKRQAHREAQARWREQKKASNG